MADPWLLLAGAAVATLIGFAWLALGMEVHWTQVHGARPAGPTTAATTVPTRRLRLLGAAALAVSLALCMGADHPSMAVLVWLMLLAGSAVAVAMTLSTRPHWLRWCWPARA
jgi:hypothetical protein